jgi:hypothetical protein
MISIYIILGLVFLNIITSGVFLILRNFDKKLIEKTNKELKEVRSKNLQHEVARMSLLRQIEEAKEIKKKLNEKLKKINDKSLEESLNEL